MGSGGEDWDAQKMLDLYIYDYMKKKNMPEVAEIFAQEADVRNTPPVAEGFLTEWWSIFWDVYSSRMQQNPEPVAESSVQPNNNEMENAQQSVHQAAPMPMPGMIHQDVPMPMADVNQAAPMLMPDVNHQRAPQVPGANFGNMMMGHQPAAYLLAGRNYEEEQLPNIPPRELNPNMQLLGANQWALAQGQAQASSSNTSPQLLQALMMAQSQQQVPPRDNRHGVNLGRSIMPVAAHHGASSRGIHQRSALQDDGKDKGVMQSPLQGQAINISSQAVGTSSYGTEHHILNSLSVVPQQQNTSATSQQPEFSKSSAQTPENPLQGSTSNAWNLILSKNISSGQDEQGIIDCEVDKPKTEDVDTFLSHNDDAGAAGTSNSFSTLQITSVNNINGHKGFSFQEVSSFHLSKTKVLCCNFSADGKYLACAGHEKKVLICNMDALSHVVTAEGHTNIITDVRFRLVSTVFATSSFDRTVQLWNAARTNKSLLTLRGHAEQVMSVDFHPIRQDFLCSCDSNNEIRLWDVNRQACTWIFKGANRQVRFQPRANLLAAASENVVSLLDTETNKPQFKLEGHAKDVRSICWDRSGKYIASVSEDRARIWSIVSGGKCIYELLSNGNKFESCTFHPRYNQLLVIGAYQTLELWNPSESSNTVTVQAHDGMIASLAESSLTDLIASASHDQYVKIWR